MLTSWWFMELFSYWWFSGQVCCRGTPTFADVLAERLWSYLRSFAFICGSPKPRSDPVALIGRRKQHDFMLLHRADNGLTPVNIHIPVKKKSSESRWSNSTLPMPERGINASSFERAETYQMPSLGIAGTRLSTSGHVDGLGCGTQPKNVRYGSPRASRRSMSASSRRW